MATPFFIRPTVPKIPDGNGLFKRGLRVVAESYQEWLGYVDRTARDADETRTAYMRGVSETYALVLDELLDLIRSAPQREPKPKGDKE